jgi:hypothetical protein
MTTRGKITAAVRKKMTLVGMDLAILLIQFYQEAVNVAAVRTVSFLVETEVA